MKNLLLIILCLFGLSTFAQDKAVEFAPDLDPQSLEAPVLDTFSLQFSFPCQNCWGEYGVVTDGNVIYVSMWNDNFFLKYDINGTLLDSFLIAGVDRVRDMTTDGVHYYGARSSEYFYVMDLDAQVLIDSVFTSVHIRGMAYDPLEDVFWLSENWSPMFYKIDRQGTVLDSFLPSGITLDHISGLAVDNVSPGGPFLWGFSQDGSGAVIVKYDIPNQAQTGNLIDVSSLGTSIAGGLFLSQINSLEGITLGGIIQNDIVFGLELGYANMLVGVETKEEFADMEIYPNPAREIINIQISSENTDLSYGVFNQTGQLLLEQSIHIDKQVVTSVNIADFSPGMYYIRLYSDEGMSLIRKFVVAE